MQPGRTHRRSSLTLRLIHHDPPFLAIEPVLMPSLFVGVSAQSQLFESLKAYLNNSRRLQPVIGLNSITECVTAGAVNSAPLYFCIVCVCRCNKSDIRNHIFGSHHRFNYIKAWHPELLIAWQEDNDLSAMAWPLMELAKMVEEKEGPGQARLIEVREALYQKMTTLSETDAVTLTVLLRGDQAEGGSCADTTAASHSPTKSHRVVLQHQERGSEESVQGDTPSHEKSCDSSENTSCFHGYTGTEPLIGLLYVVEYRSEDGSSGCFLCHCCRVRSNKKDIVDHLTGSSHLVNYLMEACPEQVEGVSVDIKTLQSLARTVEKNDCRGGLKVVNVPESLCRLLAANNYHCCLKILRGEWTHADVPLQGPGVTETSGRFAPHRNTAKPSKRKKKMKGKTDTVFSVSLPLSSGPLLLERTSFTEGRTSVSSGSPSADLDLDHFPESGSFTGNDDDDGEGTSSSESSRFQLDEGDDVDGRIRRKNLIVSLFQDVNSSPSEGYSRYGHVAETTDREAFEGRNYNNLTVRLQTSTETRQSEYDPDTPNSGPMAAASYLPGYSHWEGGEDYCYASTSKDETGAEGHACMGSGAVQHYDQQRLGYQHAAGCAAGPPAGVPHGPGDGFYHPLPHLYAARTQTLDGSVAPEASDQLHQTQTQQTHQGFDGHWA
ncbi:uncharacterized protein LOC115409221 [Salarias fasciatus]|uniref:uncharacterized protein LOC115409221 n=1 Tax=Salarias fasciatus TaxID=181472 RepID=UPI0011764A76|nr:uncharacterized protein LOC115409221 [Salarias fasciatus]